MNITAGMLRAGGLTGAVVNACISDVQATEAGLKGLYSGYDIFADNVKTALIVMRFNPGMAKLRDKFPHI